MFFPCFLPNQAARDSYRTQKLEMLKVMRDSLEARLAALNAAIETMERQQSSSQ
ncbi:MAG: hypothetical protein AAGH78_04445 [Cyanobacteria bacterium P01_H01_bin.58]